MVSVVIHTTLQFRNLIKSAKNNNFNNHLSSQIIVSKKDDDRCPGFGQEQEHDGDKPGIPTLCLYNTGFNLPLLNEYFVIVNALN